MVSMAIGFTAAAVAVAFFGSNFIPVKKYETGDGMFYQWVMAVAIWMSGLVVYMILGCPPMSALAVVGGAIWCTGNLATVPIIQSIGLGMGILIWGSANMIAGWFSGIFGLFGIAKQTKDIHSLPMNIAGLCVCLISVGCSLFIHPNNSGEEGSVRSVRSVGSFTNMSATDGLLDKEGESTYNDASLIPHVQEKSWIQRMPVAQQRLVGIALALMAGVCYGINFNPAQLDFERHKAKLPGETDKWTMTLELSFSVFTGILLASTFYFIVYCAFKKNRPQLYPKAILPGIVSGIMWAIADMAWFLANDALSFAISFPIIVPGPGLVSTLWGILLFKEISGKRNYIFLGGTFLFLFVGVSLIVASRFA